MKYLVYTKSVGDPNLYPLYFGGLERPGLSYKYLAKLLDKKEDADEAAHYLNKRYQGEEIVYVEQIDEK